MTINNTSLQLQHSDMQDVENSANQMSDTIFATARRFDKLMSSSGLFDTSLTWNRLETQVELSGPEVDFDPWLKSLIQSM